MFHSQVFLFAVTKNIPFFCHGWLVLWDYCTAKRGLRQCYMQSFVYISIRTQYFKLYIYFHILTCFSDNSSCSWSHGYKGNIATSVSHVHCHLLWHGSFVIEECRRVKFMYNRQYFCVHMLVYVHDCKHNAWKE
jgi:hypothetical protein